MANGKLRRWGNARNLGMGNHLIGLAILICETIHERPMKTLSIHPRNVLSFSGFSQIAVQRLELFIELRMQNARVQEIISSTVRYYPEPV